jgi:hypothetical protein
VHECFDIVPFSFTLLMIQAASLVTLIVAYLMKLLDISLYCFELPPSFRKG